MEQIGSLAAWAFVPQIASKGMQSVLYKFKKAPMSQSAEWNLDYRRCYIFVISAYLLYSLLTIEFEMTRNFYSLLNLYPTTDEKSIRTSFRQLSLLYHPDKVAGDASGSECWY